MTELKAVSCAVDEQETTITISRTDAGIRVYTSDNTFLSKIKKVLNTEGTQWKLMQTVCDKDGNPTGYFFECKDKKLLQLRAKRVIKVMTEEEKEALTRRLKAHK